MATGGITGDTAKLWLDAGAFVVAMGTTNKNSIFGNVHLGSKLAGKDLRLTKDDPQFSIANEEWKTKDKLEAQKIIQKISSL